MRFSNRITILLAFLIALCGLIQFIVFDCVFLSTADALLLDTNKKAANNVGQNLSSYFKKTQDVIKTIAANPHMRENRHTLTMTNSLIPEINLIFILDTQGNIKLAAGTESSQKVNFAARDYFRHAMQGETYVSNVFTSAMNRQVVAISTPIIENDSVSGVVVATVWLHDNYLASMFNEKSFGRNGQIMITDAQGIIVYHPEKALTGRKAQIFDRLQGTSGIMTMRNEAGEEQFFGYSKIPELNWLVAVSTPTAEIKDLRQLMIYQIVAITLVAILLVIAIGSYTLRRYMAPFEKLVRALGSVRKGTYHKIKPTDYASEFDEIVHAYNLTVKNLEEVHNTLRGAANIDGLTGAYNRRAFQQELSSLHKEIQSHPQKNFSIIFLDLDNLKQTNDTQGHPAGDDVLREITELVQSFAQPHPLFRYGGDEFVLILRNTSRSAALSLAERIRSQCERNLQGCTVSIGIATYPETATSVDQVVACADQALYISKGIKNTVTVYKP